jgi:hypothetical protein
MPIKGAFSLFLMAFLVTIFQLFIPPFSLVFIFFLLNQSQHWKTIPFSGLAEAVMVLLLKLFLNFFIQ